MKGRGKQPLLPSAVQGHLQNYPEGGPKSSQGSHHPTGRDSIHPALYSVSKLQPPSHVYVAAFLFLAPLWKGIASCNLL